MGTGLCKFVVLPFPLASGGACLMELVNATDAAATGKWLLPKLEGELLADNLRAANLSRVRVHSS